MLDKLTDRKIAVRYQYSTGVVESQVAEESENCIILEFALTSEPRTVPRAINTQPVISWKLFVLKFRMQALTMSFGSWHTISNWIKICVIMQSV